MQVNDSATRKTNMKTTNKTITMLGAVLSLLVTFGSTHSAAAQTAQEPPILFVAPVKGIQQILSMNADGTGLKQLTKGRAHAYSPSRSPDYRYIAFTRSGMLIVMEAIAEPRARVFAVCPSWAFGTHDWYPDGKSIVFTGSSVLGEGLWRVPVNPDTGQVGTPELLRAGQCSGPSCSPDGTKIAFASGPSVFVLDLQSGQEISFGCWSSTSPVWSPKGDKIAFAGVVCYDNSGAGYYEICTANPDLTGVTPVTSLKSLSWFPTWSPDGTRLVFESNVSGINSLYMAEIGSGSVTLFYSGGNLPHYLPNWAP
jgi:TolB protein